MKKILFYLLAMLLSVEAFAQPDIHVIEVPGIRALKRSLEALQLPVEDTVFIFDCDGTLTNESIPTPYKKAWTRGDAVDLLKAIVEAGYPVLVSSAWHDFEAFIKRIRDLGLAETLKLDDAREQKGFFIAKRNAEAGDFTDILPADSHARANCGLHQKGKAEAACSCESLDIAERQRLAGQAFFIKKQGMLVSVAGQYSGRDSVTKELYYRQKAFAPMVTFPGRKFKHVVFVEDNIKTRDILEHDVKEASYLLESDASSEDEAAADDSEKTQVHMFFLPLIHGVQLRADDVNAETDNEDDDDSGSYESDGAPDDDDAAATATTTGSTNDPQTSSSSTTASDPAKPISLSGRFARLALDDDGEEDEAVLGDKDENDMREEGLKRSTESL